MPPKTNRLHNITVHTDNSTINTFYPVAFCGASSINRTDIIDILVFGYNFIESNACLSLINTPICLTTFSADRTASCRTGLIRGIRYQQSDGAMHFYTLEVVSPDWQLAQSIHTRSFINQSTLDIVTLILSDYDLNWQISESLLSSDNESSARLSAPLYMRTQSDASDYEFVTGLLADIGISTLWVSGNSVDELGTWWLVDGLDTGELIPLTYSYAQSSVQLGQDSVHTLQMRSQQLGSDRVIVRADGLAADTIYEGQAVDESPLATDDTTVLIGAPSRVHSDDAAAHLAQQWISANHCQRETYQATGAMRGLSVGSPVSINNLPSIGSLSTHCIAVTLIGIEPDNDSVSYHHQVFIKQWLQRTAHYMQHNTTNAIHLTVPDHGFDIARDTGVWVSATLLDAAIPYCPYPSSLSFASSTYTGLAQACTGDTGLSASPSYDSSVSTDNLQQTITTPVWSGISPHDDGTTPPLRSLQLSSGSTHGWQFAPRLGQSVLLNHWYGDIDSPVISRSLYDGIGMGDVDDKDITTRDAGLSNRHNLQGGSSPRWHGGGLGHSQINDDDGHSGWISGIAQYGLTSESEVTMSFDDTPNQIGLQWSVNTGARANAETPTITSSTTFAPDEHVLELGVLRHRYSNHQSSISGQGINLATDHGLQISGDSGVLLSTFDIRHSQSEHESAWVNDAGQRQLKMGTELSETFQEAKQAHLQSTAAMQTANQSIESFKTSAQIIDETLNTEVLGAADVLLVSKDSILASASNTLWTAKTIVRQSGATQSDVVAGNYTLTANTIESLSGVGGQVDLSGLHISANREPLAIQAQGGELQLHSQRGMTIGSESGQVNVSSPKRIKLQTSAGASITIDDSGIKLVCPGTITVKAVKKSLVAGGQVNAPVIALPTSGLFSRRFDFSQLLEEGILTVGREYKIINHTKGTEFNDILPEDGRTPRIYGTEQDQIEVIIIGHEDAEELLMIENEIDNSDHDHKDEECCAPEKTDDNNTAEFDSETIINDDLEEDYYAFGN
ncbi:contractile injection system protein, VgrG/Pvc8 family [Psychrobacter sp. JCM 18902]|uniref:contractile injection system protein, VgrG/Pvc8 family n=1 Tax=Psychrobacter sp. JCM 18902 TaxID=1298607 RepID=UPI00191821DC|nr:contractile injection system protein, VgrG/Pvc8 family [Psychrobacter sp. JCM 18902]